MHTTAPAPTTTGYEHRYLRAVRDLQPAPSASGAPAWNYGRGQLLDELAARHLREFAADHLIARQGDAITLTERGTKRLAVWDQRAAERAPQPTGQLTLL